MLLCWRPVLLKQDCVRDIQIMALLQMIFKYTIMCSGCVTYKTSFGLNDWIYCTLYIDTTRDYR
jgi:hypothetical protein